MKKITLALLTLLFASLASAQDWTSTDITLVMALELDAVYGCTIQQGMQDSGGDCFTLTMPIESALTRIGRMMSSFSDVVPLAPWAENDGGYYRTYSIEEVILFIGLVPSGDYRTIVGVVRLP